MSALTLFNECKCFLPFLSGVAVNCSYMPDGKSVTCTVDYLGVEEPEKCTVTSSYLCYIHGELMKNYINGAGREILSFVVRNIQEGEYKVSVRTTCGVAYTFVNITLQNPGTVNVS